MSNRALMECPRWPRHRSMISLADSSSFLASTDLHTPIAIGNSSRAGRPSPTRPRSFCCFCSVHCQKLEQAISRARGGRPRWVNSTRRKKSGRGVNGDCTCGDDLAALGRDLRRSVHEANLIRVADHTSRPSAPFRTLRREISKAGDRALGPGPVTGYRRVPCPGRQPSLPDRPASEECVLIL